MKRKLTALLLALCVSFGLAMPAAAYTPEEEYQILGDILHFLQENSYDVPAETRDGLLMKALEAMFLRTDGAYEAFMDALLSVYDKHTMYIPAGRYEESFASGGTTAYVGVGITMQLHPLGVLVTEVTADGPAARAGVRAGDLVTHADGKALAGLTLEQIRSHIVGPENTAVTLSLRRNLRSFDLEVLRQVVYQRTFDSWVLEDGIYYMDYNNYADTSDFLDFLLGLKDLTNNRCKVLILDLRDNPGGVLLYGLSMLNRIIPDKDVAYFGIETRDENGLHTEWNYSEGIGPRLNQIIILQNGGTASAAEVVSSSLHDLGYAITVGEDTLGKARMQNHLTFTDGSAAVITTGRLVPPSQLDFEDMGLFPDWLIPASGTAHPAAGCDLLTSEPIPMNSFSANGKRLNEALIALGYLDAATLPKGTGWVDVATMAGLRKFQDDYHLIHRATVDAASVDKLNAVLTDLREGGDLGDRQLAKALELARPYLDQPLQYTVDELGNVTNLR